MSISYPQNQPADSNLDDLLQSATCPACAHHVAVPFFHGGDQPLTTLAWPSSKEEARAMQRLPLDFLRCVSCGHVFNRAFDYTQVPYSDKPNLMFNRGSAWKEHLKRVVDLILGSLGDTPTIVEIGCGDGHLLEALADHRPLGKFIGFDPHAAVGEAIHAHPSIEIQRSLFDPTKHIESYRPDLIVSRHVLEHLDNPLGFLQSLAFAVTWKSTSTRLFIEVPCIDRVFETGRTTDFFYEHNSHFTSASFRFLLSRCSSNVEHIERGYNDEVICGLAHFEPQARQAMIARQAVSFVKRSAGDHQRIKRQLDEIARSGRSVAIWGGTGKAAAFINRYGLDSARFPLVIDSDAEKVGTFVPGMGQEIRSRDELLGRAIDVVLIATQWRARDIVLEIRQHGISIATVLLEHQGRIVDYFSNEHPYREDGHQPNGAGQHQAHPLSRMGPVWPNALHNMVGFPPCSTGSTGW